MKKKMIKDNESALKLIVDSAIIHSIASENGDYKTANKNYELVSKAVDYLRKNDGILKLKELLGHDEIVVKLVVASYLLKHFEKDSIEILEEIIQKSIPFKSSHAELTLKEWKNGNLNL